MYKPIVAILFSSLASTTYCAQLNQGLTKEQFEELNEIAQPHYRGRTDQVGCVIYEMQISTSGSVAEMNVKISDFNNPELFSEISNFVKAHAKYPEGLSGSDAAPLFRICFSIGPDTTMQYVESVMDEERGGVTNREWLETLRQHEGAEHGSNNSLQARRP